VLLILIAYFVVVISIVLKIASQNTYIQNVIKENALPKFDRDDFCFYLINKKEEPSKVSSVVSVNKPPDYVKKLPFKPLPPKEESKKKKKRSKRREETVSPP
jgi:hypothetical protein